MRVAVIVTARPSWARIQTAVTALLAKGVDVQILACASTLLERYGRCVDLMRKDFPDVPITEVYSTYEGANLITSAKETGALCTELAGLVSRLRLDAAVVIADRHEVLAAAQAVSYLHVRLVHIQGGEHSGSIDDRVRHAITQLADLHLVATERAKFTVYGMTGSHAIHQVGCPSVDLAKQAMNDPPVTDQELGGAGAVMHLERERPIVVLQHPVTSEVDQAGEDMRATLNGLPDQPTIVFWPGEDAGQERMAKVIRSERFKHLHTVRHLPARRFLKLLTQASVLVGNSSVGIREASYLGVPVVNIGTRQWGRERGGNVLDVASEPNAIRRAIYQQMAHGPFHSSTLYGCGDAGERIAEVVCRG